MPSKNLLHLPPEIIVRILSYLHIHSLLQFSLASHQCHNLSRLSLHTITFGIYPSRTSKNLARLGAGKNLQCLTDTVPSLVDPIDDRDIAAVVIQDSSALDRSTQLLFHNRLIQSILLRYEAGLRTLNLTIWRLDTDMAEALKQLKGLKSLSLRVRNPFNPMKPLVLEDKKPVFNEKDIWSRHLSTAWKGLRTLRLEGIQLDDPKDVSTILLANSQMQELILTNCGNIGDRIHELLKEWDFNNDTVDVDVNEHYQQADFTDVRRTQTFNDYLDLIRRARSLKVCLFIRRVAKLVLSKS